MHILATLLFTLVTGTQLHTSEKNLAALPKDVHPAQIIVSPDQTRFAWIARNEDSISVVVDGKNQKPYDWIIQNNLEFSADSKHLIYAAFRRRKAMMVIAWSCV